MKEGGGRCECECAGGAPRAEGVLTPWTPPPLEGSPLPSLFPRASPSSALPLPPRAASSHPRAASASAGPSLERGSTPSSCRRCRTPHRGGGGEVGAGWLRIPDPAETPGSCLPSPGAPKSGGRESPRRGGGGERCRPALRAQSIECPYTPRRVPSGARRRRRPEPCAGARRAKLKLEADLTQK